MRNILDEIDISDIKWIDKPVLPLWVYGTLRAKKRFHNYLVGGSKKMGEYKMNGILMQMVSGDVFARKDDSGQKMMGELYHVSLVGLWRIFHLENQSGAFPKAYNLDVSEVFHSTDEKKNDVALWFCRREEKPLLCQDYNTHMPDKTLLEKLVESFKACDSNIAQNDIDSFLWKELKKSP